jgi:hypothetical protein
MRKILSFLLLAWVIFVHTKLAVGAGYFRSTWLNYALIFSVSVLAVYTFTLMLGKIREAYSREYTCPPWTRWAVRLLAAGVMILPTLPFWAPMEMFTAVSVFQALHRELGSQDTRAVANLPLKAWEQTLAAREADVTRLRQSREVGLRVEQAEVLRLQEISKATAQLIQDLDNDGKAETDGQLPGLRDKLIQEEGQLVIAQDRLDVRGKALDAEISAAQKAVEEHRGTQLALLKGTHEASTTSTLTQFSELLASAGLLGANPERSRARAEFAAPFILTGAIQLMLYTASYCWEVTPWPAWMLALASWAAGLTRRRKPIAAPAPRIEGREAQA